ncbi:MAG: glycoside hydrolase family 13 protein, partial [Atopobiaceae bacterium]|nr:glycoside hydrolase family 13 protein [Atopobiaceae bacterium]
MRAVHNSRLVKYRYPFGAVPVGGTVVLNLDIEDADVSRVLLRLWSDTRGERFQEMQRDRQLFAVSDGRDGATGASSWFTVVSCDEPEILWYRFVMELEDGSVHMYGAAEGRTGGEGVIWWEGEPPSFQITVYEPRQLPPSWYTDGIVYQIFPDRFARGADWRERVEASFSFPRKGPARTLIEDWGVCPGYQRDSKGRMRCWEFSGGTLAGIREKLGYLHELGISVIYLNPVFEAASPHRYDTADFFRIDPMLGTEEDFTALCEEAASYGIRIILDGVFNHVGRDSRYFNLFGNYPEPGAAQSPDSPYRDWFSFREDGTWESWWGVDDLPSIDGDSESFRELICGEDGVVRHWLRAGASGWRLDVADELPESLLEGIRAAALAEKEDALILGEVWEDASNKISYGELRHYFLGRELDGVMDYPFRDGVIGFLLGRTDASDLVETLETLRENYPPQALACSLNLIGSHDRARILTLLGGAPAEEGLAYEQKRAFRLGKEARTLAKGRLWLATLLQMMVPGVPSLYYGDEAGAEGYSDPFNRGTHPWERADADCTTIWRNAMNLRRTLPLMHEGDVRYVAPDPDVFGI